MDHPSLSACLRARPSALRAPTVMVILAEDDVLVAETVAHHLDLGFGAVVLLAQDYSGPTDARLITVRHASGVGALAQAVSQMIGHVPRGTWLCYGHNAEFLFYPFCEDRRVGEMLAFHAEERRDAMAGVVVDLYAGDLGRHPNGVDRETALFDAQGYYSTPRQDPMTGAALDQQADIFGGLRRRFPHLVPKDKHRIDRIPLFRAAPNLSLTDDFLLSQPSLNTLNCAWHRNLTCAMASFRTAKALLQTPHAREEINSLVWPGSQAFDWSSQTLLDAGLIEPGQWV